MKISKLKKKGRRWTLPKMRRKDQTTFVWCRHLLISFDLLFNNFTSLLSSKKQIFNYEISCFRHYFPYFLLWPLIRIFIFLLKNKFHIFFLLNSLLIFSEAAKWFLFNFTNTRPMFTIGRGSKHIIFLSLFLLGAFFSLLAY